VLERTDKIFSNLSEDQLLKEVAPGKNRLIYLWGHLTASHDAMFPILGLGPRLHPELESIFISNPDKTTPLPPTHELKKYWYQVTGKLLSQFENLSADEWLQRHHAMSEKITPKIRPEPIAVLLSRTNHMSTTWADDTGSQIAGPDTGRSLPPAMRASCVFRVRLRKDEHTVTARDDLNV